MELSTTGLPVRSRRPPHFRFFDLPAELRNMVYAYVLTNDEPIRFTTRMSTNGGTEYALKMHRRPDLRPLYVYKALYAEARPVFYECNVFRFSGTLTLHLFMEALPAWLAPHLRRIAVDNAHNGIAPELAFLCLTRAANLVRVELDSIADYGVPPHRFAPKLHMPLYLVRESWPTPTPPLPTYPGLHPLAYINLKTLGEEEEGLSKPPQSTSHSSLVASSPSTSPPPPPAFPMPPLPRPLPLPQLPFWHHPKPARYPRPTAGHSLPNSPPLWLTRKGEAMPPLDEIARYVCCMPGCGAWLQSIGRARGNVKAGADVLRLSGRVLETRNRKRAEESGEDLGDAVEREGREFRGEMRRMLGIVAGVGG